MYEAFIVGLIIAIAWFLEKLGGTCMIIRPIVISPIVGFFLGDLATGISIGATLELVFMGAIQIGAAVPPDALVGAGLGTAFAILSGKGPDVALALGLPIAIVAQSLKVVVFIVRSWFMDLAMRMAEDVNIRGLKLLNIGGLVLQCLMYFVVAFCAVMFGTSAVESFIGYIPDKIMSGLQIAGQLLPAVGFALLLQPMMNMKNMMYFVVGFVFMAYAELPILAITIIGVVIALVAVYERGPAVASQTMAVEESEDLFDE